MDDSLEFDAPKYVDFNNLDEETFQTDFFEKKHPRHERVVEHRPRRSARLAAEALRKSMDAEEKENNPIVEEKPKKMSGEPKEYNASRNHCKRVVRPVSKSATPLKSVNTPQNALKRKGHETGSAKIKKAKTELTMPETPTFVRRERQRGGLRKNYKTTEERELEKIGEFRKKFMHTRKQAEEYKKHAVQGKPVKAERTIALTRPVEFKFATDSRLKSQPEKPVRSRSSPSPARVKKNAGPTVPCPFNLHAGKEKTSEIPTESSLTMAEMVRKLETQTPQRFRTAKRGDSFKRTEENGVRPRMTHAHSPKLTTSTRARPTPEVKPETPQQKKFYKPVKHGGLPFYPQLGNRKIEPQPFSFDARDSKKKQQKEEKIRKVIEEEKKLAEFHAQQLPSDSPDELPPKQKPKSTHSKPFSLHAEQRAAARLQRWNDAVKKELESQSSNFHAREPRVLTEKPFIPKKSDKPLTDFEDFDLHTNTRSEQRKEFDSHLKQREAEILAQKRQREEEERRLEEELLHEQRQQAVHKAQPIRHYKAVDVHRSELNLTAAVSPRLRTSKRIRRSDTSQ